MAERETATGPGPDPSAQAWAGKWLQSDLPAAPAAGEPPTRSLGTGASSTGVSTTDIKFGLERIGRYEVLGRIGRGGMGMVYQAWDPELNRVVALKLIAPRNGDDSSARARFEREFKALARIDDHPNVVTVLDAGEWQGLPYFTMKYVRGGALNAQLDRFRADPAAAARLVAKVARAVDYLHRHGILHRDLKPHNILLGDEDEPLVADFGLVKDLGEDSDASVTGAPMGTRQYMSPEQTRAGKADYTPACDVWAIGVILYELLGGARPFESDDFVLLYGLIRDTDPAPLTDRNPAAPLPLAAVTHRCLAKAPADRYPSAAAVADDLEAWLAGDAVTATFPPPRRTPPRRRSLVALAVLLAGVAGVAGVVAAFPPPQTVIESAARVAATVQVAPPPRPAPSVAARLARGEVVEFTGADAGRFPIVPAPQTATAAVVTPDGHLSLSAVDLGAVELCAGPLPPGTRLEAEVLVTVTRDPTSWAGVYAGGSAWPRPDGPRAAVIALAASSAPVPGPNGPVEMERFGFQLASQRAGTVLTRTALPTLAFPAPPGDDPPRWHAVTVTPALPDRVEGTWNGNPVPPARANLVLSALRGDTPKAPADALPPGGAALGPRVGLAVFHAAAVYRNVRLVPPGSP